MVAAVAVVGPAGVPGSPAVGRRRRRLHARLRLGHAPPGPRDAGRAAREPASRLARADPAGRDDAAHERGDLEVAAHGPLPVHAARRSGAAGGAQRQRPPARLRVSGDVRGLGREHRLRLRDRERGHAGLAQLLRPSRQHREPELPRDRRRRRGLEHRQDLLDAGVRHLDHRWRDAATAPPPPPPPPPTYAARTGQTTTATARSPTRRPRLHRCDRQRRVQRAASALAADLRLLERADDDGDGKIDYPADPGCTSATDNNEYNAAAPPPPPHRRRPTACSNGKDDDFDGKVDYPADSGCSGPTDTTESSGGGIFG